MISTRNLLSFVALFIFGNNLNSTKAKNDSDASFFIVGGSTVGKGEMPWHVFIRHDKIFDCGGSIITEIYVLSAAHCFLKFLDDYVVVAGEIDSDEPTDNRDRQVKKIINAFYPKIYESEKHNVWGDISLVKVDSSFKFTAYVQPIKLAEIETDYNSVCNVSGWGLTDISENNAKIKKNIQKYLQFVEIEILNPYYCLKVFSPYNSTYLVCAGSKDGGKDACTWDSGGPLVCNNRLVGIVSYGIGCGHPNNPGAIYTNVFGHRKWISETMLCGSIKCQNTIILNAENSLRGYANKILKNNILIFITSYTIINVL